MFTQKKFINFRPIYLIIGLIISSILLISLSIVYNAVLFGVILLILFLVVFCLAIVFLIFKRKYKCVFLAFALIVSLLPIINCVNTVYKANDCVYGKEFSFSGYITEIKDYTVIDNEYNYELVVKGKIFGKNNKAILNVSINREVFVGNKISFSGYFAKNSLSYNNKLNLNALKDKIFYRVYSVNDLKINTTFRVGVINDLKYKLLNNMRLYMPKSYAFSYAIITGDNSYLDNKTLNSFSQSGISHILAVSGLHVGFLYGIIYILLKVLKIKKKSNFLIAATLTFFYVWFCGFTPSCLRAYFIIVIYKFASLFGLKNDKITTAFISMCAVLTINPFDFFGVGFRLSYVAYFSIILLSKRVNLFLENWLPIKVANFLSSYIAVYLGTLPIVVNSFGSVSAFSILFNVIILPIISVVFTLNFVFAISSFIFSNAMLFSILPNLLFNLILQFINSANTSLFLIKGITFGVSTVFYYLTLIILSNLINLTKRYKKIWIITCFLLFILSFCTINIIYNVDFLS